MILVYPDRHGLRALGLAEGLAHIPSIGFGGNRRLPTEIYDSATDYLRARAGFSPVRISYPAVMSQGSRAGFDNPETTRKVVTSLVSLFDYCNRRSSDWKSVQPGNIHDSPSVLNWAFCSLNGTGGQSKISPRTVDIRFHHAQHFLWWSSRQGHREDYRPVVHQFARGVAPRRHLDDLLNFPTEDEVGQWLTEAAKTLPRHTYLMIRLMLECGLRHAEARNLRIGHAPSREQLAVDSGRSDRRDLIVDGGRDTIPLRIGAEDGTKFGRTRVIEVPRPLAEALHVWRTFPPQRPAAVMEFKRRHPNRPVPDFAFFNPLTGRAYSKDYLNTLGLRRLPPLSGFTSPHRLRHYFASRYMLDKTRQALEMHRKISGRKTGVLLDSALAEAERHLQRQMGHSSPDTTAIYREWARQLLLGLTADLK